MLSSINASDGNKNLCGCINAYFASLWVWKLLLQTQEVNISRINIPEALISAYKWVISKPAEESVRLL